MSPLLGNAMTVIGSMHFTEYFEAFEDISELKRAAIIWVTEDVRRLNELELKLSKTQTTLSKVNAQLKMVKKDANLKIATLINERA